MFKSHLGLLSLELFTFMSAASFVGGLYLFIIRDRRKTFSLEAAAAKIHNILSLFSVNLRPEETEQPAPSRALPWTTGASLAGPRVRPKAPRPRPCPAGRALADLTNELSGGSACLLSPPPSFHRHSHHRCIHRR